MIKMRLEGLPEDIDICLEHMSRDPKIDVLEKSKHYPNKGESKFVRVYVSVQYNLSNKVHGKNAKYLGDAIDIV